MSIPNFFWSEYITTKDVAEKYKNQENMHSRVQNVKVADSKNDIGKRKGLSENCAIRTMDNTVIFKASSKPFNIYQDGDGNVRSRSRVRKHASQKDLEAKQNNGTVERTSLMKATKSSTEKRSLSPVLLCVISRRARSTSNSRNKATDGKNNKLSNKYFHRSSSESRKYVAQRDAAAVSSAAVSSPKVKKFLLSNEVKRRTSSSIQMWKDKMRKQYTDTLPKNVHSNVLKMNGTRRKVKSTDNATFNRTKILQRRSSAASTINTTDFADKAWQNQSINPSQNSTKEQLEEWKNRTKEEPPADCYCLKAIKFSNVAEYLGIENLSGNVEANVSERSIGHEANQNNQMQVKTAKDSNVPTYDSTTAKKVSYEKREEECNSQKRDNPYQIPYECYLEDMLNMERKKDEYAPKLSSRFLREHVNAEQRKIVVGYLIHLGVHYSYSSHIIYQTIKLFDVAIDRIFVETDNIQLLALACLWINLKREATVNERPSATMMLQLAKDLYVGQEKQLLIYEKKILLNVNFNICFVDPFSLLFYYIYCVNQEIENKNVNTRDIMLFYFCGSYLIDVTMLDECFCDIPGCMLAIAATELSLILIYLDEISKDGTWYQAWKNKNRLTEWEERVINFTKENIVRQVLGCNKLNAVYKKYLRSKHGRISQFLVNRMWNLSHEGYKIF